MIWTLSKSHALQTSTCAKARLAVIDCQGRNKCISDQRFRVIPQHSYEDQMDIIPNTIFESLEVRMPHDSA